MPSAYNGYLLNMFAISSTNIASVGDSMVVIKRDDGFKLSINVEGRPSEVDVLSKMIEMYKRGLTWHEIKEYYEL